MNPDEPVFLSEWERLLLWLLQEPRGSETIERIQEATRILPRCLGHGRWFSLQYHLQMDRFDASKRLDRTLDALRTGKSPLKEDAFLNTALRYIFPKNNAQWVSLNVVLALDACRLARIQPGSVLFGHPSEVEFIAERLWALSISDTRTFQSGEDPIGDYLRLLERRCSFSPIERSIEAITQLVYLIEFENDDFPNLREISTRWRSRFDAALGPDLLAIFRERYPSMLRFADPFPKLDEPA